MSLYIQTRADFQDYAIFAPFRIWAACRVYVPSICLCKKTKDLEAMSMDHLDLVSKIYFIFVVAVVVYAAKTIARESPVPVRPQAARRTSPRRRHYT